MTRCVRALLTTLLLFAAIPALAQTDQLTPVQFIGPGAESGAFPITTAITKVDIGLRGVEVQFTKRDGPDRWPDNVTPGWGGPLEYSVGLVLNINGVWYANAPIETWNGNDVVGGPIQQPGQIPNNWFYDPNRWAPMAGYQPQAGERIGLYVVAGDPRNNAYKVRERSNIVAFTLPAPGQAVAFTFDDISPLPAPGDSTPQPAVPTDAQTRILSLEAGFASVKALITSLEQTLGANGVMLDSITANFSQRLTVLETRPVIVSCTASIFGIPIHCAVR